VTLTLNRPWSNLGTAHRLIILDICAKLFVNPTIGSKDIERTRKCDGRTDGQTDGRTDRQTTELKQYVSPFHGGDIIILILSKLLTKACKRNQLMVAMCFKCKQTFLFIQKQNIHLGKQHRQFYILFAIKG